ncbi:thioesterase II family protein [Herbaspirillum rubrisubalbicans]|uniref:thioesterase II family protein n=1 Tax=Herbaspirillum rubrisubalbicans TaxID=80842 RepID=UPI001FCA36B2|nr:alpha/beta fold hydrolase [Herbaspirillum rubrisubalbicans]
MVTRLRLYCFPYAGGSAASIYGRWRRMLPPWLELCPVEYPGRGARMSEALHEDFPALIAQLCAEIEPGLPTQYALFGHSLGALVAFEVARRLATHAAAAPLAVLLSGCEAPGGRDAAVYAGLQGDREVLEYVCQLNGMEAEVLASQELLALMLPIIKADLQLCASYREAPLPALDCPLHVFGGTTDAIGRDALLAWRGESSGPSGIHMFEGDHFFIHSAQAQVVDRLCSLLQAAWPQRQALPA